MKRDDIRRGMVLCKPGSISASKKVEAECYILTKDEGGRHTPFVNNYKPQMYLRTADISVEIHLPKDIEMVMPGDNATLVRLFCFSSSFVLDSIL